MGCLSGRVACSRSASSRGEHAHEEWYLQQNGNGTRGYELSRSRFWCRYSQAITTLLCCRKVGTNDIKIARHAQWRGDVPLGANCVRKCWPCSSTSLVAHLAPTIPGKPHGLVSGQKNEQDDAEGCATALESRDAANLGLC